MQGNHVLAQGVMGRKIHRHPEQYKIGSG